MSKPKWKDAPDWANWLAQNADGGWCWFEKEPYASLGKNWIGGGMSTKVVVIDNWHDIIEKRP